jgi:hypothetical protein
MESIHFNIQGRHELHNGSADIINSASEIKSLFAKEYNVSSNMVFVNKIGISNIDGNLFEVYESYVDSGSDDYMYFAIKSDI